MTTVLLTKVQAAERVGLHPEYCMALSRAGRFPAPIKFGGRNSAVRFLEHEIDAWVAAKIAARDAQRKVEG